MKKDNKSYVTLSVISSFKRIGTRNEIKSFFYKIKEVIKTEEKIEEEFSILLIDFYKKYINYEQVKLLIQKLNEVELLFKKHKFYDEYKYLMDPHTAVAYSVYEKLLDDKLDKNIHTVIMSTAHPFKFPEPVAKALGLELNENPYVTLDKVSEITGVKFPEKLAEVRNSDIRFSNVIEKSEIADYVKKYIEKI